MQRGGGGSYFPYPLVVCHRVLYVRYHFRLRVAPYFFAATEERKKYARSLENHPTQKSRDVAGIRRAHFFHGVKITHSLSLTRKTHLIQLYLSRCKFFCFYHLIHWGKRPSGNWSVRFVDHRIDESAKTTEFMSDPSLNCFSEKQTGILKQETMFWKILSRLA